MVAALLSMAGAQIACSVNRPIPNPDFPITMAEAQNDLRRMRSEPVELERPVIVLAGYRSWPMMVQGVRWRLFPTTSGDSGDFLPISYMFSDNIDSIAGHVVDRVEEKWPSLNDDETIEVDVIGVSMGGLVARAAALDLGDLPGGRETRSKRLKVKRLFTMGSPHMGALLADSIAIDRAARDMQAGSAYLEWLNSRFEGCGYEIIPYAHLNDTWVGATNAAPPGQDPIWTGGTYLMSHFSITTDDRIMADLSRRLRGEEPLASPSPAPED